MAIKIDKPTVIEAAGNKPKLIEEYFGRVNSQASEVSIARMKSPAGWIEPGQTPEFNEYTVVLKGTLRVKTKWILRKDKRYLLQPMNGYSTVPPTMMVLNTLQYACQHLHLTQCIGTNRL